MGYQGKIDVVPNCHDLDLKPKPSDIRAGFVFGNTSPLYAPLGHKNHILVARQKFVFRVESGPKSVNRAIDAVLDE